MILEIKDDKVVSEQRFRYAAVAGHGEQQWRERASSRTQPEFWLAYCCGEAVGMVGGGVDSAGRFNLIAMWVRPDCRGAGIAAGLVDAVKNRAIARGHTRVILDVSPTNTRAADFYRKQGFAFIPEWEPLASHPHIQVQTMEWLAPAT